MSNKKHRKCTRCDGKGVILVDYRDDMGRPHCTEITCPQCGGTGYEEKISQNHSEILVNPKR